MSNIIKVASAFLILICFAMTFAGCASSTVKKNEDESSSQQSSAQDPLNSQAKAGSDSTSIPKNYPKDFCPVYEPSTIIDVEQINVGDKVNYIIQFVSRDDMNAIEAFYLALDYVTSELRIGNMMSQIQLGNKSKKTYAIIALEPVEESDFASYESKGYKIYCKIMVDIGW